MPGKLDRASEEETPRLNLELSSNVNVIFASSGISVRIVNYAALSVLKSLLHLFDTPITRPERVLINMNVTSRLEMMAVEGCLP